MPLLYPIHEERRDFLLLYARDHDEFYLCHRCYKLHLLARGSPPGPLHHASPELRCMRQIVDGKSDLMESHLKGSTILDLDHSFYALDFVHVQLAIDEQEQAGRGLPLETLDFVELIDRGRMAGRAVQRMLISYECKVIDGELRLRIQQVLLISNTEGGRIDSGPALLYINACKHLSIQKTAQEWRDQNIPQSRRSESMLLRCSECAVEYTVGVHSLENDAGFAIALTKWLNLGDGRDPYARTWKSHARMVTDARSETIELTGSSISHDFESVTACGFLERAKRNIKIVSGEITDESMIFFESHRLPHVVQLSSTKTWVRQTELKRQRAPRQSSLWRLLA